MTRAARRGKARALWAGAIAVALMAGACEDSPQQKAAQAPAREPIEAESRDGVLRVTLPIDMLAHRHRTSVMGTSADLTFRVYLGHQPDEKLIRLVGHAKEVLSKRDWDIQSERHFEHASELVFERGGVSGVQKEHRTVWYVRKAGRILVCDAIALPETLGRLGPAFQEFCQSVSVAPPPPPEPDADAGDGGETSDGDAATGPAPP